MIKRIGGFLGSAAGNVPVPNVTIENRSINDTRDIGSLIHWHEWKKATRPPAAKL